MRKFRDLIRKASDGGQAPPDQEEMEGQEPLNRQQRRLYLKHVQVSAHPTPAQRKQRRYVRMHAVGFGKWHTPRAYLERSYVPHVVSNPVPPRAVRRAAVSRRARRRMAAR